MWRVQKVNSKEMQFSTRAEAFAYMLKYQLDVRKADPMEAAEKANQFADIIAANFRLPAVAEAEKKGVDKAVEYVDKIVCYCDEHPRVLEFLTGAATFAVGLFAGRKTEQPQVPPQPQEKIDFNNID